LGLEKAFIPNCPDCGGDMMAHRAQAEAHLLIWACRNCGSTFTVNERYELQPYHLEIYYPVCPGCGNNMVAAGAVAGQTTKWICRICGEEIYT
jgi:DNA-directed RNA polymerase subunit M/transcription elongation factor TFIIS